MLQLDLKTALISRPDCTERCLDAKAYKPLSMDNVMSSDLELEDTYPCTMRTEAQQTLYCTEAYAPDCCEVHPFHLSLTVMAR